MTRRKKWRCRICGYVVVGERPPNICPVCGAPENDFVEVNDVEEMSMPAANKKTEAKKMFPKVTVYSTPACPYCHSAKDFLKENNVPFEDVDVSKDPKAAEDMIEKSGQMGVPVIEIGGQIIVGFNKEAIKKALKL